MLLLLLVNIIAGLLLAIVSIPLILRKIGPNPWYGFRVKKTLEDPAIWYPVNAYAGKRLLVVGLITCLSAVLLFFVPDLDLNTYALACAGVSLGGLFVTLIQSFFYFAHVPSESLRRHSSAIPTKFQPRIARIRGIKCDFHA